MIPIPESGPLRFDWELISSIIQAACVILSLPAAAWLFSKQLK